MKKNKLRLLIFIFENERKIKKEKINIILFLLFF